MRSDAIAVDNPISGTGSLTQTGTGVLLLRGAKTYTGHTFVNEGALVLDGSLAGSATVASTAVLAGTGLIGGTLTVNGTLMAGSLDISAGSAGASLPSTSLPGVAQSFRAVAASAQASLGMLSVSGDVTFASGARNVVTLDQSGGHTLLMSGGAARIGGATVVVATNSGSYRRVTSYPVLYAAGGLIGSAAVATTNPALWPWVNSTSDALLVTVLNPAVPLQPLATTRNGAAIGAAFDRLRPGATGDFLVVSRELTALDDAGLGPVLDALAGEIHSSSVQLAALDGEAATDMVREELTSRGTLETGQSSSQRWSWRGGQLWTRVQGGGSSFDGGATYGGEADLFLLASGMDWALGNRWRVGAGGGYASGDLTLDGLSESGDYSAPRGFAYAAYARARWTARGGVSLARGTYSTERSFHFIARLPETFGGGPMFGGVSRTATREATGLATEIWGDWETPVRLGAWTVRPGVSFRSARYSLEAWSEQGADSLFTVGTGPVDSLRTGGGRRSSHAIDGALPADRVDDLSTGADRRAHLDDPPTPRWFDRTLSGRWPGPGEEYDQHSAGIVVPNRSGRPVGDARPAAGITTEPPRTGIRSRILKHAWL
jgi:autotransporter-associated beta strand protein